MFVAEVPAAVALAQAAAQATGEQAVIPVMEERLDVRTRRLETGLVRISKTVQEREQVVDEPLVREEIQVERVKFLRYGEARGDYDQVVATLNQSDPHGH